MVARFAGRKGLTLDGGVVCGKERVNARWCLGSQEGKG